MNTALFYGSTTGNTEEIGKLIIEALNKDIEIFDISDSGLDKISSYEKLILGTSTWGEGELQDNWDDVWSEFCEIDFSGKTVALFGLGDQDSYADEFVDALGIIYTQVKNAGANVIGFTSSQGYEHDSSKAQIDDQFVGLVIDVENQDELTQERVEKWTNSIKTSIL